MTITQKSIKILWSAAAGTCSFPDCDQRLTEISDTGRHLTLGEMAHICGEKAGANRHNHQQTAVERDDYQNLILLCPTHHTLIDKPESESQYTVDVLLEIKQAHEARIASRLSNLGFSDKFAVAKSIIRLMRDNKETLYEYGPPSERAKRNPWSEDLHRMWLTERLSIIVPNNRAMSCVLKKNRDLFTVEEDAVLRMFQMHTRSYDRWVNDEMDYDGVTRFPPAFEQLIEDLANGRT